MTGLTRPIAPSIVMRQWVRMIAVVLMLTVLFAKNGSWSSRQNMAIRLGRGSRTFIGSLVILCSAFAGLAQAESVRAEDYSAFWLWAGVKPQPVLQNAKELFVLAGEVTGGHPVRIISQATTQDGDVIKAQTNYAVFRTRPGSISEVYNVGRYIDELIKKGDSWKFRSRLCVYDSEMILNSLIYPV